MPGGLKADMADSRSRQVQVIKQRIVGGRLTESERHPNRTQCNAWAPFLFGKLPTRPDSREAGHIRRPMVMHEGPYSGRMAAPSAEKLAVPLIQLSQISLAYGHVPLLDHVDLVVEAGERIGLIGRNGTGKSSMLKVIAGIAASDDGKLWLAPGLKMASVWQEPAFEAGQTLFEAVAAGLGEVSRHLVAYHAAAHALEPGGCQSGRGLHLGHRISILLDSYCSSRAHAITGLGFPLGSPQLQGSAQASTFSSQSCMSAISSWHTECSMA